MRSIVAMLLVANGGPYSFFFEAVCSTGEITLLIEKRKDSRMDEELLMKEEGKKGRQTVSVLYVYDSSSALSTHALTQNVRVPSTGCILFHSVRKFLPK